MWLVLGFTQHSQYFFTAWAQTSVELLNAAGCPELTPSPFVCRKDRGLSPPLRSTFRCGTRVKGFFTQAGLLWGANSNAQLETLDFVFTWILQLPRGLWDVQEDPSQSLQWNFELFLPAQAFLCLLIWTDERRGCSAGMESGFSQAVLRDQGNQKKRFRFQASLLGRKCVF